MNAPDPRARPPSPQAGERKDALPGAPSRDALLWALAATGDAGAREQLAQLALRVARSELVRRGARPADLPDLVQEAQRTTFGFLERNPIAPKDLESFLKYRAWGVLSDHRKKMRSSRIDYRSEFEPDLRPQSTVAPAARDPLRARELAAALADCRRRLPAELGRVLGMRYDAELGTEAIQRRLNVHRNTIHVRVFRALEQLRACLSSKGVGAEDLS